MRRRLNGPAWADALISRYRRQLGIPEGKAALPIPYSPQYVRAFGRKSGYVSLGEGFFGAVYPTRRPGVVLKLTRDTGEARVAAATMTMNEIPVGIVRFYDVRELPIRGVPPPGDLSWRKAAKYAPGGIPRAVYAIWREEIPEVGVDEGLALPQVTKKAKIRDAWEDLVIYILELLELWRTTAELLDEVIIDIDPEPVYRAKRPTKRARAFLKRVLPKPRSVPAAADPLTFEEPSRKWGLAANPMKLTLEVTLLAAYGLIKLLREAQFYMQVQRLKKRRPKAPDGHLRALIGSEKTNKEKGSLCLAVGSEIAKALSESPLDTVGEALSFYLDRGIMIGDVHAGNVGFAVRGDHASAVITDPGWALFLTHEFDALEIPKIGGKTVTNPSTLKRRLMR